MSIIEGLLWLTINIHNEAHFEPLAAKIAVGHVTINRAKEIKNIKKTIIKPYQFSWTWIYKGKPSKKLLNEANKLSKKLETSKKLTIPKKMHSDFFAAFLALTTKDKNNWTHYRRWDAWDASWTCKNWEIPDPKSSHVFCKQENVIKNKRKIKRRKIKRRKNEN